MVYRLARMRQLSRNPFTGDTLGRFAWYYHQSFTLPCAVLYLFSSKRKMLSLWEIPQQQTQIVEALDSFMQEPDAALLGLSLSCRCWEKPQPGDEIQLNRFYLYCQNRNLPVLDMILVHRGGYMPLSDMKEAAAYLPDHRPPWFY